VPALASQADDGESTLVMVFRPKFGVRIKPDDPLVLWGNMVPFFFMTGYEASEKTAIYVALKSKKRWLIEEDIKQDKRFRRKGSGSRMLMRSLLVQTSANIKALVVFNRFLRERAKKREMSLTAAYNLLLMLTLIPMYEFWQECAPPDLDVEDPPDPPG
jgi:hypothetical protein